MELDDLPKEQLKELIYQETLKFQPADVPIKEWASVLLVNLSSKTGCKALDMQNILAQLADHFFLTLLAILFPFVRRKTFKFGKERSGLYD